jgi:hypothetical protein
MSLLSKNRLPGDVVLCYFAAGDIDIIGTDVADDGEG